MHPVARLLSAMDLLDRVEASPRPADGVVSVYFGQRRYIGAKDRRDIAERVYAILRRRARIDWWLDRVAHEHRDGRARVIADLAMQERVTPEAVDKMFLGGDRSPMPLSKAERGMIAQLQGAPLFHHEMPAWVKGEYPAWVEPRLARAYGEAAAGELAALREEAPFDLRVNTLKGTREDAVAALAAEKIRAEPTPLSPLGLRLSARIALVQYQAFRTGLVEVQDEGSQLVTLLTGAKPGEAVVDFCAGAGGKTLGLAAMMDNRGRLVACDVSEGRIDRAGERLRRAGVHNVRKQVLKGEDDPWVKRHAAGFDRVLVDAPCTGTGTWRRNPDAKWRLAPERLDELTGVQDRVLASAARLVKPGGRLVYATCSMLPEENEERVDAFLAAAPQFSAVPIAQAWGETIGGDCPVEGRFLRLTPARHHTDGFFVAVLARAGE